MRHGFATLVQILRIHSQAFEANPTTLKTVHETAAVESLEGPAEKTKPNMGIPCLTIRDSPDLCFRAVYQDFSGCKILNTETLLQLATRIAYCKASHLFVNFEVRTTDRYLLPYTNRDLFQMTQVCDELYVKLVPSLDVQASYIEPYVLRRVLECFMDDFPLTKVVHFGPNLANVLISNRDILNSVQTRVPRIYLSLEINENNASMVNQLPPFVTLCVEGRYPFEAENLLSPRLNVVLRFSTSDPGFLCAAPESIAKKAVLATKLGDKFPVLGYLLQFFFCQLFDVCWCVCIVISDGTLRCAGRGKCNDRE
ncbi:unnamed protein product, partial [Gongylonema pulchrum]|uniref:GP-PDE domain-containing protein n=1 Tax=Gongylonema pulchrum TaxID=637853 RepID=A0A183D4K2_9BILA